MLRLHSAAFLQCAVGLLAGAGPPAGSPAHAEPSGPAVEEARVTLLCTGGGPAAKRTRSQPATLLEAGGKAYLIDAGDGVVRQLASAGVQGPSIDAIFITHLHFDHTAGLPAFMALDLMGRRRAPVAVLGPPGTKAFVRDAAKLFESGADIHGRQQPKLPPLSSLFVGRDIAIEEPTEIYRDSAIRVIAVANSHYSTMPRHGRSVLDRSYSYRIEAGSRTIAFTGDTGPSAAVENLARGADVLVSEVIDLPAIVALLRQRNATTLVDQSKLIAHMAEEHLTPTEVGKLAARAGVKEVVLTHFAEPADNDGDRDAMVAAVRKEFPGKVVAGRDFYRV